MKSIAQKENKKIFLNFYGSDWCLFCIKRAKEIFSTQTFIDTIKNKILIYRVDFSINQQTLSKEQYEENTSLAERYNPDGKILYIWDGYNFKNR